MPKLNHIRLLGYRQLKEVVPVKFNYGGGKKEEGEQPLEGET